MSFFYTSPIQINPQKLYCGLVSKRSKPERNVSIVSVINEIIFIQQTNSADVYSVNKSISATPFRSQTQTATS